MPACEAQQSIRFYDFYPLKAYDTARDNSNKVFERIPPMLRQDLERCRPAGVISGGNDSRLGRHRPDRENQRALLPRGNGYNIKNTKAKSAWTVVSVKTPRFE